MRRTSQVFRQAFNSLKNTTELDFGRSFGQHHIDRKDPLASITNAELHEHVSRAWQMDDISTQLHNYTMKENICERHFLDNVSQNSQGRYIVKLPVREQMLNNIGDSRESALKRLKVIERRFKRYPILKIQYAAFLDEYLSLGHMRRMESSIAEKTISFYLPHHCVFKTVGQAKIRVVLNASCRSSSGVSLNDLFWNLPFNKI